MSGYIGTKAVLLSTTAADVTGNADIGGDLTVDTNTLYVDSTNNRVGVGTSSPSGSLHVERTTDASIRVKNTLNNANSLNHIELYNNDETGSLLFGVARSGAGGGATIKASQNLATYIGGSEAMRITSDGSVGIGTTAPTHNLHVTDTGTPNLIIETTATSGSDAKLRIRGSRTTSVNGDLAQILFETNDDSAAGDTLGFITAGKDVASTNKGVIRFGTTTTNGGSPSEHMRINSNGETIIDQLSITGSSRIIDGYESGVGTISTGTSASSYTTRTEGTDTLYVATQTITFSNSFSGTPKVFVFQYNGNAAGHASIQRMWANSTGTNSFVLVTADLAGSSSVSINWIAIRDKAT